jgi:hypothetical protein
MTPEEWGSDEPVQERWKRCECLEERLRFLTLRFPARKQRLFLAGCCRRIWDQLVSGRSRYAVQVAERLADGLVGEEELQAAREAAWAAARDATPAAWAAAKAAARTLLKAPPWDCGWPSPNYKRGYPQWLLDWYEGPSAVAWDARMALPPDRRAKEEEAQLVLSLDIADGIFLPLAPPTPAVLGWHDGTARRLAESIYQSRRFEDLPVLADLLEEAGLTDTELLGHLRLPGPHCLGCWALDTVLGKS